MHSLTVLYDADCGLCRWVRGWLEEQPQLVPLHWVPCGSPQARVLLPRLDHDRTRDEITVVADDGTGSAQVWTAEGAWIACLWATANHRDHAYWLSHPRRRGAARSAAITAASRFRRTPPPAACSRATARDGLVPGAPAGSGPHHWVPS